MDKIKIDIISGFLGAGKTTFIKHLMDKLYTEENVVILENEFGRINIDQETLGREGLIVKPIQARCICCSGSNDLYSGMNEIIREFSPNRIIIEPTGVAKLSEIKKIIQGSDLVMKCEIEHIVTIADAKNYQTRTMISKEFFEDQIRASEVIFLSKTDQLETDKIQTVKEAIHKINRNCLVIVDAWDNMTREQLVMWINHKQEKLEKQPLFVQLKHRNDFENYELISNDEIPISWTRRFTEDADQGVYGEIHRIKGICKDSNSDWYSVEAVPGETIIKPIPKNQINNTQSQICIIGRNLDTEKLQSILI
jgi:Putative GTPases (G3E family)